jgi:hypothetical protein
MHVAWVQLIMGVVILVGSVTAFAFAFRRILGLRAVGHPTSGWATICVLALPFALLAAFLIWRATPAGGTHIALDQDTVSDLGGDYFDEHYYANGQVSKDGFDEWQRFVKPDYTNATATVDDRSSGEYCIRVTRQYGGRYGEDGHHTGYRPTKVERKRICIPVVWNDDLQDFEATESEPKD